MRLVATDLPRLKAVYETLTKQYPELTQGKNETDEIRQLLFDYIVSLRIMTVPDFFESIFSKLDLFYHVEPDIIQGLKLKWKSTSFNLC